MKKSKRAKACDISAKVKKEVWERDGGRCVICGNKINVMPNAHYIPRSAGGLGVAENILTMCTNFTENKCHYKYDFGTAEESEEIRAKAEEYLRKHYPEWDPEKLVYRKWDF